MYFTIYSILNSRSWILRNKLGITFLNPAQMGGSYQQKKPHPSSKLLYKFQTNKIKKKKKKKNVFMIEVEKLLSL